MKDIIVYGKQAAQLVKAVVKAQEALGEVYQVMAGLGISTTQGETVQETTAAASVEKPARVKKEKAEKPAKAAKAAAKSGNGAGAFSEL